MALAVENALAEIGGMSKRVYDNVIQDTEQRDTVTYDTLPTKAWELKGDGWFGDAHLQRSSSFKFASSLELLPQDTNEINRQFNITRVEMFGRSAFTKDFLTRLVKGGDAAFGDYTYKVNDLMKSQKKNQNQACYIGPSMARATTTAIAAPGATSLTIDSIQYLFDGIYADLYDSTGTTLIQANIQLSITNTTTVGVSPPLAPGAAAGSRLWLHEENGGPTNPKGFNSLQFQCDDGTSFTPVFEGLSRSTYFGWRGISIDALGAPLTNDFLQKMQNTLKERSGHDYMTENYVNFVHLDSIRRYITIILPQKRYINATKYDSGMEKPGMLEWNGKGIVVDSDCPKTGWFMYNLDHGGKMEVAPLGIESDLGGSSMKYRSNTMIGEVVTYFNGAIGTNKPNSHVFGKNLIPVT